MRRRTKTFLGGVALVGLGLTGLLLVQLVTGGAADRARRDGGRDSQRGMDPLAASTDGGGPARTGGGGSADPRAGRTPATARRPAMDDAKWQAQLRESESRVLQLLGEIPATESVSARQALFGELQRHIRMLGSRLDRSVRDKLLEMLTTAEPRWRRLVGQTLGYLEGDTETARKLLAMHKQQPEDVQTRQAILLALGNMKVDEILPELVGTLKEGYADEDLIVDAIGRIGGEYAQQALVDRLDGLLLPRTRQAIERVVGDKASPALLARLAEDLAAATDPAERVSIINILSAKGKTNLAYAPAVRELLETARDDKTRQAAIRALGLFGDPASGEALLGIIQEGTELERSAGIRAIQTIKDPATVATLARHWDRLALDARMAVIGAGARLPSSQADETLIGIARDALKDSDSRVRNSAAILLGIPGRNDNVDPLADFVMAAGHPGARNSGIRALLKIGTREAAEAGLRALRALEDLSDRQRRSYEQQFQQVIDRLAKIERRE